MYRGRFAPTPSGPLHFGSLIAAVGSYLDARAHGGEWHVRIDDLDPPRVQQNAANEILRCLERFGLHWNGPLVWQHDRALAYQDALAKLSKNAHVYACTCTRAQIAAFGLQGIEGYRYPGTCRDTKHRIAADSTLRMEVPRAQVAFDDLLQGHIEQALPEAIGDFVVKRSDGVYAYHLACVVDDAASNFNHIVRGADLIESTPRQIFLQRCLELPTPQYLHLPVALDAQGHKLSKQTLALPVDAAQPMSTLKAVLTFLNHAPPEHDVAHHDLGTLRQWAIQHWDRAKLTGLGKARPAPTIV